MVGGELGANRNVLFVVRVEIVRRIGVMVVVVVVCLIRVDHEEMLGLIDAMRQRLMHAMSQVAILNKCHFATSVGV